MNLDNGYVRCFVGTSVFLLCIFFAADIIIPIDKEHYDKQYDDYINIIGVNCSPDVIIEDGYFHGYNENGLLVAAHGIVNENGVKEDFKFIILPPFIKIVVVEIEEVKE